MVKENLEAIRKTIPAGVLLVAVSKTKPVEDIQEAYDAGQRVFGENHALAGYLIAIGDKGIDIHSGA